MVIENNLNEDKGANTQQGDVPKEVAGDVPRESKEIDNSSQGEGGRNGLNAVAEDDAILSPTYYKRLSKARQKIKDQLGKKVEVIRKRDKAKLIWTAEEEVNPITPPPKESNNIGLKHFNLTSPNKDTAFADLFLHLCPQPWETEVRKLNEGIQRSNETTSQYINEFIPP